MTLASERYANSMPLGWHSSTWGGGKVLDNNYAWTVLDTYMNYRDPVFQEMTYLENQLTKSEYISAAFDWLRDRHPNILTEFSGMGGMWGFSVRYRDDVCTAAW